MVGLLSKARLVITDSGGVQEETTSLGVPWLASVAFQGDLAKAIGAGMVPFLVWDAVKLGLAAVAFPAAWWFGIHLGAGPSGIWAGLIAGLVTCAAFLLLRYRHVTRVRGALSG